MKKQIIDETIFEKRYDGERDWFEFGDLPTNLLPTDKIKWRVDPGFFSENDSWDPFSILEVLREREETDSEFQKRCEFWQKKFAESRKDRYEKYLKLKKEFEEDNSI